MIRDQLTAVVLTFNEAPNLARTLERLRWVPRVLVVDSFSTDTTLEIARSFPNVSVVQRAFDTFAGQCNFALTLVATEWVLSLDADYVLTPELERELAALDLPPTVAGASARFRYCVQGRPLRATLYPPRTVLYRRAKARYHDEGHGHRVSIDGQVAKLNAPIDHDDRKPLDRWFSGQNRYMIREAEHLLTTPRSQLNFADRVRLTMIFGPPLVFFYTLLAKGLILDGWRGWFYVLQRTLAELLLALRLIERRLSPGDKREP